jgi:hypothetical protein
MVGLVWRIEFAPLCVRSEPTCVVPAVRQVGAACSSVCPIRAVCQRGTPDVRFIVKLQRLLEMGWLAKQQLLRKCKQFRDMRKTRKI